MNDPNRRLVEDTPGIRAHDFHKAATMVEATGLNVDGELPFLGETLELSLSKHDGVVDLVIDGTSIVLDAAQSHLVLGTIAQWYFRCPECDCRRRQLYRPTLDDDFACRECHGLTYRSVLEQHGRTALYKAVGSETGLDWKLVRDLYTWMIPGRDRD